MREKFDKLMVAKEREEKAHPALIKFLHIVEEQEKKQQPTEQVEAPPLVLFSYR